MINYINDIINMSANPQPPNDNPDGVRCYIRYNNQGVKYTTCNKGEKKGGGFSKPPSQITPKITAEEFAEKHGGYAKLGKVKTKEYHRLYMANQRAEEYKQRKAGEELVKIQQLALKQEKARIKAERIKDKLDKEKAKKNRKEYLKAFRKLSQAERKTPAVVKKLKEKFNQKVKKVEEVIEELQEELNEQEEIYDNLQEEIVDGKKVIKNTVGADVKSGKGGKVVVEF